MCADSPSGDEERVVGLVVQQLAVDQCVGVQPTAELFGWSRVELVRVGDAAFTQDLVYRQQGNDDELSRPETARNGAPESVRVGPRPPGPILLAAKGDRHLVDHVVAVALVGKRQHRDLAGRTFLIVVCDGAYRVARIGLDDTIKPGLPAVRFQLVLLQEERPRLVLWAGTTMRQQNDAR